MSVLRCPRENPDRDVPRLLATPQGPDEPVPRQIPRRSLVMIGPWQPGHGYLASHKGQSWTINGVEQAML